MPNRASNGKKADESSVVEAEPAVEVGTGDQRRRGAAVSPR
jgi:hypothetical protein